MFSTEPRVTYRKNQLGEVICQLRFPEILSIETLCVEGHEKRGRYVPCHLHLNVTYLLEADLNAPVRAKPDENSAVAWIAVEDIPKKSTEKWFVERIYRKLCEKAKNC